MWTRMNIMFGRVDNVYIYIYIYIYIYTGVVYIYDDIYIYHSLTHSLRFLPRGRGDGTSNNG